MGLISLTWVFCHNMVQIHLEVIEILSFSCFVLLLVKADANHLAVPNCRQEGPEALNRSPEYTGQSQTFNFEIRVTFDQGPKDDLGL